MKYRFQGLYELDSLAVVNVRDAGPVKNAFKILMFPETRMYQADSAKTKVSLVIPLYWEEGYNCSLCVDARVHGEGRELS